MKKIATWVFCILFGLAFISVARREFAGDEKTKKPPAELTEAQLDAEIQRILAQQCIAVTVKNLHDPESAQLPNAQSNSDYPSKFYLGFKKKNILTIQFEMRAKNGFGALRAQVVDCQFKKSSDGYKFIKYNSWQMK